MALELLDSVSSARISPSPIKNKIVSNEFPTIAFVRYLQDLRKNGGDVTIELNKIITQVNLNIKEINLLREDIDSLEDELNETQIGAGLNGDGTYVQPLGSNYIDSSTSLANADFLLDAEIKNTDSRQKIINKSTDYQALEENQIILANAISGLITITLPNPSSFIVDNTSKTIGITKIDTSSNRVNIVPFASETIVGETQQRLRYQGEVLNFITDGINWYLGA